MADRNKNKIKVQVNKAVQSLSAVIKPTSQIKTILQTSHRENLTQRIDKIHETMQDNGQQFIISQFNKDPKSNNYRSPYSNKYFPVHNQDAFLPSPLLRDLEEKGNILFQEYARLYYGEDGCISNFYVFETQEGLNFAFFVKKIYKDPKCYGVWCSSNQIQVRGDPSKSVSYKLTSSALYQLNVFNQQSQQLTEIYGSIKKNKVESKRWLPQYQIDQFHLLMSGRLIEEVQTNLRQQIQSVFIAKTKQITFKTRFINSRIEQNQRKKRAKQIAKMRSQSAKVIQL